jgi:hypothetical protein
MSPVAGRRDAAAPFMRREFIIDVTSLHKLPSFIRPIWLTLSISPNSMACKIKPWDQEMSRAFTEISRGSLPP